MVRCDVRADNTALRSVGRHPHYIFVHVFFLVVPPALLPAAYPARPLKPDPSSYRMKDRVGSFCEIPDVKTNHSRQGSKKAALQRTAQLAIPN